jgi:hypothetical protein
MKTEDVIRDIVFEEIGKRIDRVLTYGGITYSRDDVIKLLVMARSDIALRISNLKEVVNEPVQ